MGGNDYFFQIKNMNASESANSGKDHIDPEDLKRWEDEEMLDSIWHLFITEEDGDRPIVEGQDGEQYSNDDEDNAYDAGSSILQALKSQTPSDPASSRAATLLSKAKALKRWFNAQYDELESSHLDFYPDQKTEIADQLALNRVEFEGIDTDSRSLIEGFWSGQSYISNSSTSLAKWLEILIAYDMLL